MLFVFFVAAIAAMVLASPTKTHFAKSVRECRMSEKKNVIGGRYIYMRTKSDDIACRVEQSDAVLIPYQMNIFKNEDGYSFATWVEGGKKAVWQPRVSDIRSFYGQKFPQRWVLKKVDGRLKVYCNKKEQELYCLENMLKEWGLNIDLRRMDHVWETWTEDFGSISDSRFFSMNENDSSDFNNQLWVYNEMNRCGIDVENPAHPFNDADHEIEREIAAEYDDFILSA